MKKIKIVLDILNSREKNFIIIIFILVLIASLLEIFSVATILPVITAIFSDGSNSDISFLNNISKYLKIQNILIFLKSWGEEFFLIATLCLMLILFILKNLYIMLFVYIKNKFTNSINFRLSNKLLNKYIEQPYNFYLNTHSSKLIKNIEDVNTLQGFIDNCVLFVTEVVLLIFFLVFLSIINFQIVLVSFTIISIFVIILKLFTSTTVKNLGSIRYLTSREKNKKLIELFQLIKEIKIYSKKLFFIDGFDKKNQKEQNASLKFNLLDVFPKIYLEVLFIVLVVASIIVLKFLNFNAFNITILLGIFAASGYRIIPAINRLIKSYQMLNYTFAYVKIIHHDLNLQETSSIEANETSIKFNNKLILKDIDFRYSDKTKVIFNKLNFVFNKGEINGITGESGSGKSTLVNLLTGLLSPLNGKIICDETSIDLNISGWRKLIGYVPQDSAIIDTTIAENIAIGLKLDQIDKHKLDKAIQLSNLKSFVQKLPEKEKTLCGERGNNLSGGQKQRVCIARALYFQPEILILDESTSAVSKEVEKEILDDIKNLKNKITIILISHSPEPLSICDNILNLKKI